MHAAPRRLPPDQVDALVAAAVERLMSVAVRRRYQAEATLRAAIRIQMIADSWPWGEADGMAALIVSRALDALGIERPPLEARGTAPPIQPQPCERCGTMFKRRTLGQRFCSKDCRSMAARLVCEHCARPFLRVSLNQRFCSRECWLASLPPRPRCAQCGRPVRLRHHKFCGRACYNASLKGVSQPVG